MIEFKKIETVKNSDYLSFYWELIHKLSIAVYCVQRLNVKHIADLMSESIDKLYKFMKNMFDLRKIEHTLKTC